MSKSNDWTDYGARSDELPLVDQNGYAAVFVTELAKIERVPGECVQMTFARAGTDGLGNPQLLVDGPPLIMPLSLVPELVAKLAAWVKAGSPANRRRTMTSELTDAIERITRMTVRNEKDEDAIGVYSTGERIAVALVLNRLDLLPRGGYSALEAIERLGAVWTKAALVVQRPRE